MLYCRFSMLMKKRGVGTQMYILNIFQNCSLLNRRFKEAAVINEKCSLCMHKSSIQLLKNRNFTFCEQKFRLA